MKKHLVALMSISLLAVAADVPAAAQAPGMGGSSGPSMTLGGGDRKVDPIAEERREQVDRNYRAVKGTIPAQATAVDPWANMRGPNETAPANKPAPKSTAAAPKKKSQAQ